MADISKITLPSGTQYNLKDAQARADIEEIQQVLASGIKFIGTTTTAITDGATTNPIKINNKDVTVKAGDMVVYGSKEFVFDGTKWIEFGDLGSLKALAFKDSASGSFTPAGSVNVTTNTTTNKTTTVGTTSGTATYTPAGSVAAPTISVKTAGSTTSIKNPTSTTCAKTVVAAAPGAAAPSNSITYYDVSGEVLSLYQLGYTTGAAITTSNVTVKTSDAEYEATAPAFSGTGVRLVTGNIAVPSTYTATFTGTAGTVTVS